ncbi:MAG: sulfatase-like hydrolase/transferase [Deltaproteobacteria bacterium]|nr:sulfatase-like hydrolase/transferase [Deltaproteobacteria bacterium]
MGLFPILLLTLLPTSCQPKEAGSAQPWNVLVVTLDTTRADFLGCYGKESARTPNLDRLAAEGALFTQAFSAAPVTLPSHSTLFTGTYPLLHGVRDNGLFKLPLERTTLAEVLSARGYATAAVIGAFPLTREFGLDQGFDLYDDHITVAAEDYRGQMRADGKGFFFDERPAERVNDAILPWLRTHGDGPFFAWIHYWDAHHPHIPPAPYDELYSHDLYQGEIASVDQNLGVILRELERQGIADRTLIVVSGDHGEGRGEHNEDTHSLLAYDSTLRVPFIFRAPGLPPGLRISERVGTVDAMPTILELLGFESPQEVQGRSLVALLRGEESSRENRRTYYAEAMSPRFSQGWGELRALYQGSYKYIYGPRPELFDLSTDPGELRDLVGQELEIRRNLELDLAAFLRDNAGEESADAVHEIGEETRQRLAALGYISGGGGSVAEVQEVLSQEGTSPQDRIVDNNLTGRWRHYASQGNFLQARETALKLIARAPENSFYQGMLAKALFGLGQLDEAVAVIGEAVEVSARDPAVFLNIASELYARGEQERGLELVRKLNDQTETAYGQYLLAEMVGDQGDTTGRRASLQRALELDPKHTRARLSLAVQLAQDGERSGSEDQFRQLLVDHPLFARGHFNFGVFLLHGERTREALERLDRAVQLAPSYWQAHLARLTAHLRLGTPQKAAEIHRLLQQNCRDDNILEQAEAFMASP